MPDTLITEWAQTHAGHLASLPDEHWQDTLSLAALITGPLAISLRFGASIEEVKTAAFASVIAEPLSSVIAGLEHVHVSARVVQFGGQLAPMSPRGCAIFVPRSTVGRAMITAAIAIATDEAHDMYGPHEPAEDAESDPQKPATPADTEEAAAQS